MIYKKNEGPTKARQTVQAIALATGMRNKKADYPTGCRLLLLILLSVFVSHM
jgi:hypothetical protein